MSESFELDTRDLPSPVMRLLFSEANRLGVTPEAAASLLLAKAARQKNEDSANLGATHASRIRVRRDLIDVLDSIEDPADYTAAQELVAAFRSEIKAMELSAEPMAATPDATTTTNKAGD